VDIPHSVGTIFEQADRRYVFSKDLSLHHLRRHDLMQDAPIIKLTCGANVLIYPNIDAQTRALAFTLVLRDSGFLFLGTAEMLPIHLASPGEPIAAHLCQSTKG